MSMLTPVATEYAARLMLAGFTVYVSKNPQMRVDGKPVPVPWFHYARDVGVGDGGVQRCYGSVNVDPGALRRPEHSMPIRPSREDGSSILTDIPAPELSVAAAEFIAAPKNFGSVTKKMHDNVMPAHLDRWYRPAILTITLPEGD